MTHNVSILFSCILAALLSAGCYNNLGTGTETSNKTEIQGLLYLEDGTPAAYARVVLLPAGFNPALDTVDRYAFDTVGTDGKFRVTARESGLYNLQAISTDGNRILLVQNISLQAGDVLVRKPDTLRAGGTLIFYPTPEMQSTGGYVFLRGTTLRLPVEQESALFYPVPGMVLPPLCYNPSDQIGPADVISSKLAVAAGDTTRFFTVCMVVDNPTNLRPSDTLILARAGALGGIVIPVDDHALRSVDYDTFNLVVISSTCDADVVDTFFTHMTVPIMLCENHLFSRMHLTDSGLGTNYGSLDSQKTVRVVRPAHPIASGLQGEVAIFNSFESVAWGRPAAGADMICLCTSSSTRSPLFCYDKGALMAGISAPHRRVGIFNDVYKSVLGMNENGWALFGNSILWALGQ